MNKNYEPKKYSISDMKKAVKERRRTKEMAKDVFLQARKSKEIQDEINLALEIVKEMEIKHNKWIQEKIKNLSSYYSESALRTAFIEGLATTITQENRLGKKITKASSELEDLIVSYFFDFYRILRICQDLGVNHNNGVEIAKRNYYYNPHTLIELNKKYKDKVYKSILEKAFIKTPKNPEEYIKRAIYLKDSLMKEFEGNEEVTTGLISFAVSVNVSNPRAWIERYLDQIKILVPKYEGKVSKSVIKLICQSNYLDPENSIKRYIEEIDRLLKIYPEDSEERISRTVIERAVRNYSNPDEFIKKFIQLREKLQKKFPEINPSTIERIIMTYGDPESFIYYFKRKCDELASKQEYEEITSSAIEIAILSHTKPEEFLDYFIKKVKELKNNSKYKNLNHNVIETAVENYSNPEIFLDKFIEIVSRLKREFGHVEGINDSTIEIAATSYQSNPEDFLKKYLENRSKCLAYYKDYSPKINVSVIEEFCRRNPKNPKIAIDRFIEQRKRVSSNPRYKNLNPSVIEVACRSYQTNPENFLENFILLVNRLKNDPEFKDLDSSVIERAVVSSPKNPERFLRKYKIQVAYLSSKYPDVYITVIKEAALNFSTDAEKYIINYLLKNKN